ncbi:Transcription elongation factor SPT6-like [Vitis vinifera]|uniref:Transcription elongation factor SPT6-like n=1 Tax=Vitis vinifera TaxID=29760 RepID=A0A438GWL7_VITVI|nr:Transcription elongation factor SPT6-like [Vitis vinifera]
MNVLKSCMKFKKYIVDVMDRYVDPLVTHLKAMLNYRKFRRGKKVEVDDLLRAEKSDYPMRIVYCFGICHEHPGAFILSYIRNTNPHHEYIGLYPKGFKFREHTFDTIDRLVAYFQKHIDDPWPEKAPSIQSVAAMVPMRSPAVGHPQTVVGKATLVVGEANSTQAEIKLVHLVLEASLLISSCLIYLFFYNFLNLHIMKGHEEWCYDCY